MRHRLRGVTQRLVFWGNPAARIWDTSLKKSGGGFTIAELMIATAVFSIVLLVGAEGVIQLGRNYYKGVTVTQTQEAAKNIVSDVSGNIRLSSSVSTIGTASNSRYWYCVGNSRYTFRLFNQVNASAHDDTSNFGMLEDEPTGGGCGNPFDGSTAVPLVNPTELLGNQMQLIAFCIQPVTGSVYSVKVSIASGSDQAMNITTPGSDSCQGVTQGTAQCQGKLSVDDFCAVTTISAAVYEGVST